MGWFHNVFFWFFVAGMSPKGEQRKNGKRGKTCPNRCADEKSFKMVKLGSNTAYVPIIMYENPRFFQQIFTEVFRNTPYHELTLRNGSDSSFFQRDETKMYDDMVFEILSLYLVNKIYIVFCLGMEQLTKRN